MTPIEERELERGEPSRELWQPDRNEQLAAVEILLASPIPRELRSLLRERELELARRYAA